MAAFRRDKMKHNNRQIDSRQINGKTEAFEIEMISKFPLQLLWNLWKWKQSAFADLLAMLMTLTANGRINWENVKEKRTCDKKRLNNKKYILDK